MHWPHFDFMWGLFIGVILPTYNLLEWLGNHFGNTIKRFTIKSERDAIAWIHYRQHFKHDGHAPKTPEACTDGQCREVNI